MAGSRRTRSTNGAPLTLVATSGAAPDDELEALLHQLSEAGVPDEVLQDLRSEGYTAEQVRELLESGPPSPEDSVAGMLQGFTPLLEPGVDPLEAEMSGSDFLGVIRRYAEDEADVPDMLATLLEQAEATGSAEALAMVRLLAVLGPKGIQGQATAAADRMVAGGLTDPGWARGLGSPKVGKCFGYGDIFGEQESIALTFSYGRRHHALMVLVDHGLGGGVKDCFVLDAAPAQLRKQLTEVTDGAGCELHEYTPAWGRELLEQALAHEPCPQEPDQVEDVESYLDLLRARVALLPDNGGAAAPPKPQRASTTVHRVKVSLRGAKPRIWRRLDVPSDITLLRLHDTIQRAFGWFDSHLWVFDTPDGEYGLPDPELGHAAAARKPLEEVAPATGAKLSYTYDFGDHWEHEILIESVHAAESDVAYPRCVTGRRACPPEDCGGLPGYYELLQILANPEDDEHEAMLDWLGLSSADELDPAAFRTADANNALADLARRRSGIA